MQTSSFAPCFYGLFEHTVSHNLSPLQLQQTELLFISNEWGPVWHENHTQRVHVRAKRVAVKIRGLVKCYFKFYMCAFVTAFCVYVCVCMCVTKLTHEPLDKFSWNLQKVITRSPFNNTFIFGVNLIQDGCCSHVTLQMIKVAVNCVVVVETNHNTHSEC